LDFLKSGFEILAFFKVFVYFGIKKGRQSLVIFQLERFGSGKTLPELHLILSITNLF